MRKIIVGTLCFFFISYAPIAAQQEVQATPKKHYQIGFFAGVAYDDLFVLSGAHFLEKKPRLGFEYALFFAKNPQKQFHFRHKLAYAGKGFLQETGSAYGTNALFSAHYAELVSSICAGIRPNVQVQIGFGAALNLSQEVLSDEVELTLADAARFYPSSALVFEPAIQFGSGTFVGRISYNAFLFTPFVVDVEQDGSLNMATVRQQRIALSVGYFFSNKNRD